MKQHKMNDTKNNTKNKQFIYPIMSILIIAGIALYWNFTTNSSQGKSLTAVKDQSPLAQGRLTFISPDSSREKSIIIEIAEDDYSRVKGLMYRETLPENQGMLFIFDKEEPQAFWMKNTHVSLDMIFVNKNKKIIRIHKYTEPYTTKSYTSGAPAIYVVEVVAGFSDQYGIEPGWSIDWKRY